MLRPVRPDIGAAVAAAGADHSGPQRPDNGVVGEVVGIHRGLVVTGNRVAVDEQIPAAVPAMWPSVTGSNVSRLRSFMGGH
jgi:hypothetical protein